MWFVVRRAGMAARTQAALAGLVVCIGGAFQQALVKPAQSTEPLDR